MSYLEKKNQETPGQQKMAEREQRLRSRSGECDGTLGYVFEIKRLDSSEIARPRIVSRDS